MKNHVNVLLCSAAVVSGLAFARGPVDQQGQVGPAAPNPADHKIELLEKDIVATRLRAEEVAGELRETRALLDATVKYLAEQAASAKNMSKTLDESEQAGFTWGINPDSRHILLRGWREELAAMQKNVPSLPATKPAGANGKDQRSAKVPGSQ